jgi:hypothetical protein
MQTILLLGILIGGGILLVIFLVLITVPLFKKKL